MEVIITSKISIIIPIYNNEQYLRQCLDSVAKQTHQDLDIILIDDGSTDGSGKVCDEYAKLDARMRVIHQQNTGLSGARNTGLDLVVGDYVLFLDSDDWLEIDTCKLALAAAEEQGAQVVFWSYVREYSNRSLPKQIIKTGEPYLIFDQDDVKDQLQRRIVGLIAHELHDVEHMDSLVTACAKLYRVDVVKNIRFIDTQQIGTEDMLFNLFVFSSVRKAVYINRELYHYRRDNATSLTRSLTHQLFGRWKTLFRIVQDYLHANAYDPVFFEALNNRISLSIVGVGMSTVRDHGLGFREKISALSAILGDSLYRNALRSLPLVHFDLKWKLFFLAAKHRLSLPLYFMLQIMVWATTR